MHDPIIDLGKASLSGWEIIGLFGAALFFLRWIFQMSFSHKAGKPMIPRIFWYMSMSGSMILLVYFIFGQPDKVGIISNLFPMAVAMYNLHLSYKEAKNSAQSRPLG